MDLEKLQKRDFLRIAYYDDLDYSGEPLNPGDTSRIGVLRDGASTSGVRSDQSKAAVSAVL